MSRQAVVNAPAGCIPRDRGDWKNTECVRMLEVTQYSRPPGKSPSRRTPQRRPLCFPLRSLRVAAGDGEPGPHAAEQRCSDRGMETAGERTSEASWRAEGAASLRKAEALHVSVNRAPVLTLWAAVVAERLGFDRDEALTMGRVVAGLNAYAKGKSLGKFKPVAADIRRERQRAVAGKQMRVDLLHRAVPVVHAPQGWRALSKDRPVDPDSVQRYLESKFGDALVPVEAAMNALARSLTVEDLAARAFELYEAFRPAVPAGTRGWGAAGVLDLARIRSAGG
jgi:hypothetical protein